MNTYCEIRKPNLTDLELRGLLTSAIGTDYNSVHFKKLKDLSWEILPHACIVDGIVKLPKKEMDLRDYGVTVYFAYCSSCNTLWYGTEKV